MSERSEVGLTRANEEFYAAFEALDLDRMAALWARATRVSCVHPGWDLVVGAADVMESWREIFQASVAVRVEVEIGQVTLVGDAGWVLCREIVHTSIQGQPVENQLTALNAFVWEDGAFRICHHHAAPRLPGRPDRPPQLRKTLH